MDSQGNRTTYDVGPWYVATGAFCTRAFTNINLDGLIDVANGEWKPSWFLDDDERQLINAPEFGQIQRLYGVWDANAFYLGWQWRAARFGWRDLRLLWRRVARA